MSGFKEVYDELEELVKETSAEIEDLTQEFNVARQRQADLSAEFQHAVDRRNALLRAKAAIGVVNDA